MQEEAEPIVGEVAEAVPTRLIFLMSRFIASVGPLLTPPVSK